MAPFGKHILKTLFKHRSSRVNMEHMENQIVVWVFQEEKIVTGLTKYTTCVEIVRALLEDHDVTAEGNCFLLGHHHDYRIVEKWRGFERILPSRTKIFKLWKAWGKEQIHLNFVLVKADAFLSVPMFRSAEAKIDHNIDRKFEYSPAYHIKTLPLEKRKRIIKKAFRKLSNMKKDIDFQDRNNLETLIHIIISQDHTIKQQIQRIEELDKEIGTKEAHLHLERFENNGVNYVQNLYLKPVSPETENESKHTKKYFAEQVKRQEELLHLEENLNHLKSLISSLSSEIEVEICSIYTEENKDKECFDDSKNKLEENNLRCVKQELHKSLKEGLHLHYDFECIQEQIKCKDSLLLNQEREFKRLEEELQSFCNTDTNSPLNCQAAFPANSMVNKVDATDHFTVNLCGVNIHDTDSDTGISSGHSQDSEPAS
ncbi:hypothetical protein GDO86_005655 [Hymenochirus boettgeri]|uniref:Ras-associating domain-containing protein n=1 Tax=Hymenochirus boettgeri TaxID=247094 RepID=A0A8T2J6Z6_9PIPI|nr:hypothetical protein GDO86_005655 [Hymenochirus boettgeri]